MNKMILLAAIAACGAALVGEDGTARAICTHCFIAQVAS